MYLQYSKSNNFSESKVFYGEKINKFDALFPKSLKICLKNFKFHTLL